MTKIGEEEVPQCVLLDDRKSFGNRKDRNHSNVIVIQCRAVDANYSKKLMTSNNSLTYVFVPTGYHISMSPKRILSLL